MRATSALVMAALAVTIPGVAFAQTEVRNDGFDSGAAAGFQAGFVTGEIGAVRLSPPQTGVQVLSIRLLFGGSTATQTVTVHVWDDSAGTLAPGAELYSGDFQIMGSNSAIHDVDLSAENILVPGNFRVGIEFQHSGVPSIARDDDGTITASRNFIYDGQWFQSQTAGLTGDWVIRAMVSSDAPPDAGPGPAPDAGTGGGECQGNADCGEGEYCDIDVGACTFDCREDTDCGGGMTCNSLGQCIAADGGGGGCCETGRGGAPLGAVGLGALVTVLATRRRRGDRAP